MKYKEILKTNETNKYNLLIICVSIILLLLTLCYFGINSGAKGTNASDASAYYCASGVPVADGAGKYYCCPSGNNKIVNVSGDNYCFDENKGDIEGFSVFVETGNVNPCVVIVELNRYEDAVAPSYSSAEKTSAFCSRVGTEYSYIYGSRCGGASYGCSCGAPLYACASYAEKAISASEQTCFSKYNNTTLRTEYYWGDYKTYGGYTVHSQYKNKAQCLIQNTNGYGCVVGISSLYSTSSYMWTNESQYFKVNANYNFIDTAKTEKACLSNNKCYKSKSGSYYWGYVWNPSGNGYTEYPSLTTKETCLAEGASYNIKYNLNGGVSGTNAPTTGNMNEWVTISNPTKETVTVVYSNGTQATMGNNVSVRHEFNGWIFSTIGDSSRAQQGIVTGNNITFYSWTKGVLSNGSSFTKFKDLSYTPNSTVTMTAYWSEEKLTLPTVTKSGYKCTWNTLASGAGTSYDSGATITVDTTTTQAIQLFAHCTVNTTTKTMGATFYPNGGTLTGGSLSSDNRLTCTTTGSYCTLDSSKVPSATRLGYTFSGWREANSSTCKTDKKLNVWSNDTDFYACWEANAYTITFDANGGSVSPTSQIVRYDGLYGSSSGTLPIPTRNGYTFTGWYTALSGGTQITASTKVSITANQTLYARWEQTNLLLLSSAKITGTNMVGQTLTANMTTNPTADSYTYQWYANPTSSLTSTSSAVKIGGATSKTYTITSDMVGKYIFVVITAKKSGYNDTIDSDITDAINNGTAAVANKVLTPTLIVDQQIDLKASSNTTVSYTYNGDGTVSCLISDTSVATCSVNVSTKQVTITGKKAGTVTLTLSALAGNNYSAKSVTAVVNVSSASSATKTVTIPTNSLCVPRTYNGKSQQLINSTNVTGYTLSGYNQTNAGTYQITAKLTDDYKWSDGTPGVKEFTCSIAKASPTFSVIQQIDVETSKTSVISYTYDGDGTVSCLISDTSVATCSVNVSTKQVTITGKRAGNVTLTLSALAGNNYYAKSVTAVVNVNLASSTTKTVTIPTNSLCVVRIYNGKSQQLISTTNVTGYTLSGYNQTNAGTYPITAKLTDDYKWSDGTTGVKEFTCSMSKANPTLSLGSYGAITTVGESKTVTYTYDGDGTVGCTSANDSIATCSLSGGEITIIPKAEGTTTVTLNAESGKNYNAVSQQVSVIVNSSGVNEELSTNTYTAIFNANDGILNGNKDKSCSTTSNNCTITELPTASKDGYTFKGWGTSSSCTSGSVDSLSLNKNETYYACYTKNNSDGGTTPGTDSSGNTNTNPETGEITMAIVWFVGIFAIAYAALYFKKVKEN